MVLSSNFTYVFHMCPFRNFIHILLRQSKDQLRLYINLDFLNGNAHFTVAHPLFCHCYLLVKIYKSILVDTPLHPIPHNDTSKSANYKTTLNQLTEAGLREVLTRYNLNPT